MEAADTHGGKNNSRTFHLMKSLAFFSQFIVPMWDSHIRARWAQIQCTASVSLNFLLSKACILLFFGWGGMYRLSVFHTSLVVGQGDDE